MDTSKWQEKKDNVKELTEDSTYWDKIVKNGIIIIISCGFFLVLLFYAVSIFSSGNDSAENQDSDTIVGEQQSTIVSATDDSKPLNESPIYKIGDTVTAGKFAFKVNGQKIANEIDSEYGNSTKTDNQFVIVNVTMTNNDDSSRDFSTSLFRLIDADGREYEAADITYDDYLYYETINPGLSKTYYIAFETSKGLSSNLKLKADSGVLLAGGETVEINLN